MKKLCIASIIMCILLGGCNRSKEVIEAPKLLEPVSVNIDTAIVNKDKIFDITAYNAQVIPYTEELSFPVSGNAGEIKVVLGDTVKKGQVLITLDESNLETQIKALKDTIANTKKANEYSNTLLEYDLQILELELSKLEESIKLTSVKAEIKELQLAINIKQADMDIAELKIAQSIILQDYELKKTENTLDELTNEVGDNTIIAPFDGEVVYLADLSYSDWVSAKQTVLAISDPNRPLVKSDYISEGTLKFSNRYYALIGNREYKVTLIPNDMEEYYKIVLSGGTPTSTFAVDHPDKELSFGDFSSICLVSNYVENTMVVPIDAIYKDTSGKYVYLMNGDTRVRQSVTVGITTNAFAEITEGLLEGDEVYVKN